MKTFILSIYHDGIVSNYSYLDSSLLNKKQISIQTARAGFKLKSITDPNAKCTNHIFVWSE
jgi:hypothetical protein